MVPNWWPSKLKILISCLAEPVAIMGACRWTANAVSDPLYASIVRIVSLGRLISKNWIFPACDALTTWKWRHVNTSITTLIAYITHGNLTDNIGYQCGTNTSFIKPTKANQAIGRKYYTHLSWVARAAWVTFAGSRPGWKPISKTCWVWGRAALTSLQNTHFILSPENQRELTDRTAWPAPNN